MPRQQQRLVRVCLLVQDGGGRAAAGKAATVSANLVSSDSLVLSGFLLAGGASGCAGGRLAEDDEAFGVAEDDEAFVCVAALAFPLLFGSPLLFGCGGFRLAVSAH
eukprot:13907945-Alexandrium_andersonii.AAC.1